MCLILNLNANVIDVNLELSTVVIVISSACQLLFTFDAEG